MSLDNCLNFTTYICKRLKKTKQAELRIEDLSKTNRLLIWSTSTTNSSFNSRIDSFVLYKDIVEKLENLLEWDTKVDEEIGLYNRQNILSYTNYGTCQKIKIHSDIYHAR